LVKGEGGGDRIQNGKGAGASLFFLRLYFHLSASYSLSLSDFTVLTSMF
jgi:hypothetical protein